MTAEESICKTVEQKRLYRKYWELNKKSHEISLEMAELRKEYCKTLPFKVGDFVELNDWAGRSGWIARMVLEPDLCHLHVYANPPKKDGTRSKREVFVFVNLHRDELPIVKIKVEDQ